MKIRLNLFKTTAVIIMLTMLTVMMSYAADTTDVNYEDDEITERQEFDNPNDGTESDNSWVTENESAEIIEETDIKDNENTDEVSLIPGENNAYVVIGESVQSNMMTFYDGIEAGIKDQDNIMYSEPFEMDGIVGRRVYKSNRVRFKVDSKYYQPEDNQFILLITFYDFGPAQGTFGVRYCSESGVSAVTVVKPGITPRWMTQRVLLNDVKFDAHMEGNADIEISTNLYNAFAKIELINLSAVMRSGGDVSLGTVNSVQAGTLEELGLMRGKNGEPATMGLEETLTRGEAIRMLLDATGYEDEAINEKMSCSFNDVLSDLKYYIGFAEKLGIVKGTGDGKFNPERDATPRELLMFYFRLLGIDEDNMYENAMEIAQDNQLLSPLDMVLFPDRSLTRDNFVAIAYNSMSVKSKLTGYSPLERLIRSGVITGEMLDKTGVPEMSGYKYIIPTQMEPKKIVDEKSGRTYYYLNFNGKNFLRNYFDKLEWNSDETKFLVGSGDTQSMYEYDTTTGLLTFLDFCDVTSSLTATVTPNDQIFYRASGRSEIWQMNWKTYEKHKVCSIPEGFRLNGNITPSHDGKYFGVFFEPGSDEDDFYNGVERYRWFGRYSVEDDEWTIQQHTFNFDDGPSVGHPQLNPVYPNLMFFCHEGTANLIPDRLWVMDMDTGEAFNVFKQAENRNGTTGEGSGHEIWSMDGENLYFIKYNLKSNKGKNGICRISKDGTEREYFNDDYSFWHSAVTADERWVGGDTNTNPRNIAIVSTETYKSYLLAEFHAAKSSNHPFQPHPTFSPSGKWIMWQTIDENNIVGCAWMNVSDITGQKFEGGIEKLNDDLSYVNYVDSQFEAIKVDINGKECIKSTGNSRIYIDINDELAKTQKGSIKLKISYLDSGRQPIDIVYTSSVDTPVSYGNQEDKVVSIKRNNSGKWKNAEIILKDMSLYNSCKKATDFAICGRYSEVCIENIEIEILN